MQQAVLAQDPALEPPAQDRASTPTTGAASGTSEQGSTVEPSRIPGTSTRLIGRAGEQRDLAEVWDTGPTGDPARAARGGQDPARPRAGPGGDPPVWYVALEQIPAAQSVAAAILDVVAPSSRATDASEGVRTALGTVSGLLVLDGCEGRPVEVAREVSQLLAACPRIRVLATSRERLGILDEALHPGRARWRQATPSTCSSTAPGCWIHASASDRRDGDCRPALRAGRPPAARHGARGPPPPAAADRRGGPAGRVRPGPLGGQARGRSRRPVGGARHQRRPARRGRSGRRCWRWRSWSPTQTCPDRGGRGFPARPVDAFEVVARLVDASLVQVRSAPGPTRYELLRTVAAHTLEGADEAELAAARARYADAVLARAAQLAGQLATADRSDTLRLLDREMPHVRAVLGRLCAAPVDPAAVRAALEVAVGLTDYWLGRHPAEGLDWLGRLVEAAGPSPAPGPRCAPRRCSAGGISPTGSRTSPWAPRSARRPRRCSRPRRPARRGPGTPPSGRDRGSDRRPGGRARLPGSVARPARRGRRRAGDGHDPAPPRLAARRRRRRGRGPPGPGARPGDRGGNR